MSGKSGQTKTQKHNQGSISTESVPFLIKRTTTHRLEHGKQFTKAREETSRVKFSLPREIMHRITARLLRGAMINTNVSMVQRSRFPSIQLIRRQLSTRPPKNQGINESNRVMAYYLTACATFVFGLAYASVPLYKMFCQMTGFGGTTQKSDEKKAAMIKPVPGSKVIRVIFAGNVHSELSWKFVPTQREVKVVPGETALAFYTVSNPTDRAITGVASYNVFPPKAGLYFSKIQCFCFEEQRLGSKEEIDMPVFFYIDPDFVKDPSMDNVNTITLSYTFFKTGEEEPEVISKAPNSSTANSAIPKIKKEEATGGGQKGDVPIVQAVINDTSKAPQQQAIR